MKIRTLLYILCTFICSFHCWGNTSVSTEILIDESSELSFESIKSEKFDPIESKSVFNNFSQATYWLKITPNKPFSLEERILLSNSYNHYESIYFSYSNGSVIKKDFGSNQLNESKTYLPSFKLNPDIKTIYISIESNTFLYESFDIMEDGEVNRSINNYILFQILFLGFILFVFAYTLLLYLKTKRIILARYLLYLLSVLFMFLFISNLGRYYLWGNLPFSSSFLEIGFSFFMVWSYLKLTIKITKIEQSHPTLGKISTFFLYFSLALIIITSLFFHPRYLSLLANTIPMISLLFLVSFAIIGLKKRNSQAGVYLFGIISFILGMSIRILINWGILDYSLTLDSIVYLGLFVELILFTYVVILHIEHNIKSNLMAKVDLEKSKEVISQLKASNLSSTGNIIAENFSEKINQNLHDPLTERESSVLEELMQGGTQKEIAEKLFISINTLKTHISRVYSKLDSKNRIEAINNARRLINEE